MVEYGAYLLVGKEQSKKQEKIESIKDNHLDKKLKDVDFEVVYSNDKDLDVPRFNEILSYPPQSLQKKRIIHLKRIETLSKNNREVLLKYLKKPLKSVLIILDAEELDSDNSFAQELSKLAKIIYQTKSEKLDAFDLARAILAKKTAQALKILKVLLNKREEPQNILGALFWQWDNSKDKLSLDKFREGLKLLLSIDLKIKTGKLKEDIALEMLVIRLSYLV